MSEETGKFKVMMENVETPGDGSYRVALVGESLCAGVLAEVDQGRRARGEEVQFDVCLLPETLDAKGANGLKVVTIDAEQIGWLAPEETTRYKPAIDALFLAHRFLSCPAKLVGGEGGRSALRVVIDLPKPQELLPVVRPLLEEALRRAQAEAQEQQLDARDDLVILLSTGRSVRFDDLPPNEDFRFPDDPQHFIRFSAETSKEWFLVEREVPVSGISHAPARRHAEAFIRGSRRQVVLERDPTNPFDQDAVKVVGLWLDEDETKQTGQIGWLPRELAKRIASGLPPNTPLAAELELMFAPTADTGPGVRLTVLRPRAKRLSKEESNAAQAAETVVLVSSGETIRYGDLAKGQDYRRPNEHAGWIYVAGEKPGGDWVLATASTLEGLQSGALRDAALAFIGGKARGLGIERADAAPSGETRINVIGSWRDQSEQEYSRPIGNLESFVVQRLARESLLDRPLCLTIRCMARPSGSPAITVDIWRPHKKHQHRSHPA